MFRTVRSDTRDEPLIGAPMTHDPDPPPSLETELQEFMHQSSSVYWISDVATHEAHFVSRAYHDVWGVDADVENPTARHAMLGPVHPDDRAHVMESLELARTRPVQLQYRIERRDGTVRRINDRVFPIRDADGRVRRLGGIAEDITDHAETLDSLTRSEELFRALTENSAEIIGVRDANGTYTYMSPSIKRILGYDPEEVIGKSLLDLAHPDDMALVAAERVGLPERGVVIEHTVRMRHKDGGYRTIAGTAHNMLGHPAIRGWLLNARDVTDSVRAEQSERFQGRLLAAVEESVIATDYEGRVTFWNAFAEQLYGYTADEAMGRTIMELTVAPESPDRAPEILAAINAGTSWSGEMVVRRKDESRFTAQVTTSAIHGASGRVTAIIGVSTDVTRRLQVESHLRQSQKTEAVGRLAGGVAHDFNNLLTVITAHAEFLERAALTPEEREDLGEVRKAAARAAGLTRQLLAFSRQQVMEMGVVQPSEVANEVHKMLRRLIGEDIEMQLSLRDDTPAVLADRGQLEQVILNLVMNARDAMPGGGRLAIETRAVELPESRMPDGRELTPGRYAALTVRDTGEGMTTEVQARIFDPFYSTKETGKGTGLGLATVHGIVEQSGGFITVESSVGVGSTFTVYLPAATRQAPVAVVAPRSSTLSGTETVLLVEDEAEVRHLARRILVGRGYTVLEARRGGEALSLLTMPGVKIDLLVTDAVMPGMSGQELAAAATQIVPGLAVVVMSGYTNHELARRGGFEVAHTFLHKPFSSVRLLEAVRAALGAASG
ncbi:MAG: domain S-box protein [Gemmatimonadetes bacterium]|nr:domain S-box protein [Gemmatimonadota bacterium]